MLPSTKDRRDNDQKEGFMSLTFDHIHLISQDAKATANCYQDLLGGEIIAEYDLREAPQINVRLGGAMLIIRGQRPGEEPVSTQSMQDYTGYSSHNEWGTDHFGFTYQGDLLAYCEELKGKGATMSVEPWEFTPGNLLCYVSAPDGVSIEIVQGR
jgi:catechol 2,3-dioxygenase-like lactoylglutathione lyase family enzyme